MAEAATKSPIDPEAAAPARPETTAPAEREELWTPFETLRREIDRLFDDFRPTGWRLPFRRPSVFEAAWPRLEAWQVAPAVDMVEKDAAYEITAELPGLDEKNVEIKLSNGNMTITGEKQEEKQERKKEYYLSERRFGSFQRTFRLPEDVDTDKIEASFRQGVLMVTLPKTPATPASEKRIAVRPA